MSRPVVTVRTETTVKDAAELLAGNGFTAMPVLDEGDALIGMGAGTDVVDLVTVMLDDRIRSVPIVDGHTVVGIVTRRDLLRVLARADSLIARAIRHRLANYGGGSRWTVEVHGGAAAITDEYDDATDRHVAAVIAEGVPGVTSVHVVSVPSES
jgi:CBS domain-containing protein